MAAKVSPWLYEKRPLKRPKLGAPDVYPQEPKQREDELTAINVKQGFLTAPTIQDEYGSARNTNITANKFGAFFSSLLAKKQEINTFQDSGRRRQQFNAKDNILLVTPRTKPSVDAWFKDLASGSKTLMQLAKKVPIFNKREEILTQLSDFSVPMFKAAWFIKMSVSAGLALSESGSNKSKKRQMPDPASEWTNALCKYMRELYGKLSEHYHDVVLNSSSKTSPGTINPAAEGIYKQWQYCTQLARHLFEEGLLERHELVLWLLDLFEKVKSADDPILRLLTPLLVQYSEDFTDFELLSRRLAHHCAKKISALVADYSSNQAALAQEKGDDAKIQDKSLQPLANPFLQSFRELLACSHHRNVLMAMASLIQIIALKCPTALVWHSVGEGTKNTPTVNGSPLDFLPCPPSSLPMPKKPSNPNLRQQLKTAEDEIRARSRAVENKWTSERWKQTSSSGTSTNKLLTVLDALDRHCFDRIDNTFSLDTLCGKIFTNLPNDDSAETRAANAVVAKKEEPLIKLLCEWAVTPKRTGEHRALVVAKLLERRQSEIIVEKETDGDDKEDSSSPAKSSSPTPAAREVSYPFQNLLMNFLDTQAPILDERSSNLIENRVAFSNLVILFGELIRCEVFSHDVYMCTLISRGLFNSPAYAGLAPANNDVKSATGGTEPSLPVFLGSAAMGTPSTMMSHLGGHGMDAVHRSQSESSLPMFDPVDHPNQNPSNSTGLSWNVGLKVENDDAREDIDADLDKLLQHINERQQNNQNDQTDILLHDMRSSDKDKSDDAGKASHGPVDPVKNAAQRHLLYTTHFPLPQDEANSHDVNQRHVLLFGVGRTRGDEAKHSVKKVTKDIMKLFSRKSSMDISEGGKVKAKKPVTKDGFNFESALTRFQGLSYYDQHAVTTSCAVTCVEMLNSVAASTASYLPQIEAIAFLFDLFEMALNVHGLIEFVIAMLKELVEVEIQLQQKCPFLAGSYCSSIGLYIVSVLYRFQSCLLVSHEETVAVFEGFMKMVKHAGSPPRRATDSPRPVDPADCSSAERCILSYLYEFYNSCNHLRTKYSDVFAPYQSKIKISIANILQPATLNLMLNPNFMMDYINNPKQKVDAMHLKQLNDNPTHRYSFVCNAVLAITIARDPNQINEIAILCAEVTSRCPVLCGEWIGVLKALCCSSNPTCGFMDAIHHVKISDLSIHDNLAIFVAVLIARKCFSMQDFVIHCALPSLLAASPAGGGDQGALAGARISCHLLLCLFKTSETFVSKTSVTFTPATILYSLTSPGPNNMTPPLQSKRPAFTIKHPCDRYLLTAAHSGMRVEAVIAVLKAILVLGDSNDGKGDNKKGGEVSVSDLLDLSDPLDDDFMDFGPVPFPGGRSARFDGLEAAGLGEFAKHALKQICNQEWVHEKCLRDPEMLCKPDLLLDAMLSQKLAQKLLHMICRLAPAHHASLHMMGSKSHGSLADSEMEQKHYIARILQNLDEWTLRISWLQLQLVYAQCTIPTHNPDSMSDGGNFSERGAMQFLEHVAKATVDFFQACSEESSKSQSPANTPAPNVKPGSKNHPPQPPVTETNEPSKEARVWLVAPLIAKLPAAVQGKILRVAANVLEAGNWMKESPTPAPSYSAKNKDRNFQQMKNSANNNSTSTLLSYAPFLSLVLLCLKGQDDQRESLLRSLYTQLHQAVDDRPNDDLKTKLIIQEGLTLRLSLVGGMFDMIQKSQTTLGDWAVLFLQLVCNGVVEPQLNYDLFTTVLDMLSVLIHSTQAFDSSDPREDSRKHFQTLMRKLKKEMVTDRSTVGINMVKQLLPISKQQLDVITCEPMGSLIDTKGNKIAGFDSIDKKQGLQVAEKQKVSPWDLLEGHKSPAPLCWTWFGMVRYERKPTRNEEHHHALQWHTHGSMRKPTSYFLEPPPLPPLDAEPIPPPVPVQPVAPPMELKPQLPPQAISNMIPGQMPMGMHMPMNDELIKREANTPSDTMSPRGPAAKKPKAPRKRKATPKTPPIIQTGPMQMGGQHTPPIRMNTPVQFEPGAYGAPPPMGAQMQAHGPPQGQPGPPWFNPQGPNTHVQGGPHQGYGGYPNQPQQPMPPVQNRSAGSTAKGPLSSMLRARQPAANQAPAYNQPNASVPMGPAGGQHGAGPVQYQQRPMTIRGNMRPNNPQQLVGGPQNPNQMYQQMQGPGPQMQSGPGQMVGHHMGPGPQGPPQQQSYGPGPGPNMQASNISYGNQMPNQMQMQPNNMQMDINRDQGMGHVNQGYPQQNTMMNNNMRAQMGQGGPMPGHQQHSQSMQQGQQQFVQRPPYGGMQQGPSPNVTMGQMGPGQGYNPQMQGGAGPMGHGPGGPQHMRQQMAPQMQQQQMLQRQLSQGKPQQHNHSYNQSQY